MLSKLRWTCLITMSVVLLIAATSESLAITITTMSPYSGSSYDAVVGDSHTAYVATDVPYVRVDWYVDGVFKESDSGNGSATQAYFTYTFNSGSTTGQQHEVKAYAYGQGSAYDTDFYDVTVWSDLEDVSTPSKSVSNEMEVNGSYSVSFSMSTPNSNYRITHAEVWVDGSQVASQNYSEVTSATINASGSLGLSVGAILTVELKFTWKISGTTIALYVARYLWNVAVRSEITGTCTCSTDDNALDNGTFTYSGTSYDNSTAVEWDAASGGNNAKTTSIWGTYAFTNVPCGYYIIMSVSSIDTHIHGSQLVKTCFYDDERSVGPVGTRWSLVDMEIEQDHMVQDFDLSPYQTEP